MIKGQGDDLRGFATAAHVDFDNRAGRGRRKVDKGHREALSQSRRERSGSDQAGGLPVVEDFGPLACDPLAVEPQANASLAGMGFESRQSVPADEVPLSSFTAQPSPAAYGLTASFNSWP